MAMDKYSVAQELNDQLEKYSHSGCPECGAPVKVHGTTIKCPNHGTEPFEQDKNEPKNPRR